MTQYITLTSKHVAKLGGRPPRLRVEEKEETSGVKHNGPVLIVL